MGGLRRTFPFLSLIESKHFDPHGALEQLRRQQRSPLESNWCSY